jgi:hypothetical protein
MARNETPTGKPPREKTTAMIAIAHFIGARARHILLRPEGLAKAWPGWRC